MNFWSDIRTVQEQTNLQKADLFTRDSLPAGFASHGPGHCRIISIWYAMSYWLSVLAERQFCVKPPCTMLLKCDPSGVKGDSKGALTWDEAERLWRCCSTAVLCSMFNHCGDCFAGKFREKASILHKIAKKKCQVEDSEKANGVASRSGRKLAYIFLSF